MPRPAAFLLLAACATDPNLSEDSDAITDEGASLASSWQADRAIKTAAGMVGGCTATRVSARYALTAAHCLENIMQAEIGDEVAFYNNGPSSPSGRARIEQRHARPGVNPDACYDDQDDCYDDYGYYADIALLRLSADDENDLEGPHATFAWKYPGPGVVGKVVGAGRHNGAVNTAGTLRQTSGELDSDDDVNGMFETDERETDDGDSGGPFYATSRVVGVLAGAGGVIDTYGRYTSVPFYIHWLLTKIGYVWRGVPPQANTTYVGDVIESSVNSELACQYACEKTTSCEAYNWNDSINSCGLYENVNLATTQSGWRGALKHGRNGTSGDVVGYVRSDGIHAVVHAGTDARVRELALVGGQWSVADIHGSAPLVASKLSAVRRADGTNAVYYRSSGGHIIELALTSTGWKSFDLVAAWGAPSAAGAPAAYVRSDGVTAVVYRATNGHIIELRLGSRGWIAADLSVASGSSVVASSDPSAFVRSDGMSSIVFRAGAHIWELYQANGQPWEWGVPSQLTTSPPPAAASRPVGYTHRGGINAIVYRSTADQLVELYLIGSQWYWGVLANGAKGDPTAYTRADGREAAVFRDANGHIIEAANTNGWSTANLTSITGADVPAGDPYVYHRADGYNIVLFESGGHVNELAWKRGLPAWSDGDLTSSTGETP